MVDFTLWDILRNLLLAARWTVALSLVAFIGGGLVGMALLVARTARWPGAERFVAGYVQLFQGTPLLMQLFLAYFGLALFGVDTSAWVSAALALTLFLLLPIGMLLGRLEMLSFLVLFTPGFWRK